MVSTPSSPRKPSQGMNRNSGSRSEIGPGEPSAEFDPIAAVRARIGAMPLAVSLDLHANLRPAGLDLGKLVFRNVPPACLPPV